MKEQKPFCGLGFCDSKANLNSSAERNGITNRERVFKYVSARVERISKAGELTVLSRNNDQEASFLAFSFRRFSFTSSI